MAYAARGAFRRRICRPRANRKRRALNGADRSRVGHVFLSPDATRTWARLSEERTPSIDFCSIEVREHTRRAVDPRAIEGPRDPRCGCSSRVNATNAGRAESASRSPPSEGASHANVERVPLLERCRAPLSSSRVVRALECGPRATKRPRPPMLRGSAKSHAIRRVGRFPSSDPRCAPVALRCAEDDAAPYAAAKERHCRWRRPRLCSTATRLTLTESSEGGWTDR